MSIATQPADPAKPKSRLPSSTELSWCKAVPGGTGITVLAVLLSEPVKIPFLQNVLRKIQISHPILNTKLHFDAATNSLSYVTPRAPYIQIQPFDLESTSQILQTNFPDEYNSVSPFHLILEHELNKNSWENPEPPSRNSWENPDPSWDVDLFFASLYTLENSKWVVALRLHTSACDRAAAVALLREMLEKIGEGEGVEEAEPEVGKDLEVSLGIEAYIPSGQGTKPFWAHGVDMLGYSLNSFRLANLDFKDTASPRISRVIRLQMNAEDTSRVLSSCESKEIKLCSLLSAAGILASHTLNGFPVVQWEKYAVVTLMDCRSILDPVLNSNHMGFYHSAILNTHDVYGEDTLWELAKRVESSFVTAKNNNKHFKDMADVNFLMCKAIDNPRLTPLSALRTSLISVFEDPVIDHSTNQHQDIGLEDFVGCASVHGVGPSIAVFDTVRDGKLDCACVFPFPLHSREQMQELIDGMKKLILNRET